MSKQDAIVYILLFTLASVLLYLVYLSETRKTEYKIHCEENGGVLIAGVVSLECVDKKFIIEVKK